MATSKGSHILLSLSVAFIIHAVLVMKWDTSHLKLLKSIKLVFCILKDILVRLMSCALRLLIPLVVLCFRILGLTFLP